MDTSSQSQNTFTVVWRIKDVESWFEMRKDALYSPQFLAETLMNTRWKLRLTPNWQLAEKYIGFSLQRDVEDDYPNPIDLIYELEFEAEDKSPLKHKTFTSRFAPKTAGDELNVKQSVILKEKKEDYLPEGGLTVKCTMKMQNTVSKKGGCLLHSIIGMKSLISSAFIDNYRPSSTVTVNFMPHSADISLISLDVSASYDKLKFKRKHVDCKNVCWYSYELVAIDPAGDGKRFEESNDLLKEDPDFIEEPNSVFPKTPRPNYSRYFINNTLSLQLQITYYPGVKAEFTKNGISKDYCTLH